MAPQNTLGKRKAALLDLYWTCVGVPSEAPTSPDQEVASTTFRLTDGRPVCRLLILKGLTAARRHQNRYAWRV